MLCLLRLLVDENVFAEVVVVVMEQVWTVLMRVMIMIQ